ncbi:MAG: alpha-ketoglutarate-dependent dioxygenase AlkB [Rudaea sp.]
MRDIVPHADLFDAPSLPQGLEYHPGFVTPAEEVALLTTIANLPFREATFRQYTARRRVVRYGRMDDPDARAWPDLGALPAPIARLRRRISDAHGVAEDAFAHALVTEYRPGTPIGWHRDKPAYGAVFGVSLASGCRMRFRPWDDRGNRAATFALELAPRSLYVMRDDIRWGFQHHIPPVEALRYSITFRTAR